MSMFDMMPFEHRNHLSYNPFRDLDNWERSFFGDWSTGFNTDIKDKGDHYELEADLPGVKKEDIAVEDVYKRQEQGYAYTTVKKVHILLNEYFRYLTEEAFIQKNPMQSVPMMKRANFLAAQDKECVSEQEQVTAVSYTHLDVYKRQGL